MIVCFEKIILAIVEVRAYVRRPVKKKSIVIVQARDGGILDFQSSR